MVSTIKDKSRAKETYHVWELVYWGTDKSISLLCDGEQILHISNDDSNEIWFYQNNVPEDLKLK